MARHPTAPLARLRKLSPLAAGWIGAWLLGVALWLLLVSKLTIEEVLAAMGASALACIGVRVFQNADRTPLHPTAAMLLQSWRIPGDLLRGAWTVFEGLARYLVTGRAPPGALRAFKLDLGQSDDPKANARRALIITYTTLTPSTVVMGFVPEQQLILCHQFVPSDELAIAKALEACR
jgi:multisubunit Na+/H+ antiporter MnhE subunit